MHVHSALELFGRCALQIYLLTYLLTYLLLIVGTVSITAQYHFCADSDLAYIRVAYTTTERISRMPAQYTNKGNMKTRGTRSELTVFNFLAKDMNNWR